MPRPRTNKSSADRRTKKQLLALVDFADRNIAKLTADRDEARTDLELAGKARDWNAEKLEEVTRQHARDMAALKRRLADAERECNESLKLRQTRESLEKAMETSAERYRALLRVSADLTQLRSVVTSLADAMRAAACENGAA